MTNRVEMRGECDRGISRQHVLATVAPVGVTPVAPERSR